MPSDHESPATHPGLIIKDRLKARGWSQDELADITGTSRQNLNLIMNGRRGITPDMAVALAAAFGDSAEEWLQWDAAHQLSLVEADPEAVSHRARLYQRAPIRDMQKRGWIGETNDTVALEQELQRFFGGSLQAETPFPIAPFRSNPLARLTSAEEAWCVRARQLAEQVPAAEFDRARLDAAAKKLRQLAAYPNEVLKLPQILGYYGIRFVVVEPLPNARIDGAAFWLDDKTPVIAISARWDRVDALWFTVMHEFMHIKNGDALSIDVDLFAEKENGIAIAVTDDAAEARANREAAELLVPQEELESFIRRVSPLYAATRIIQFAHRVKMHPGVIVGQLQHKGELRFSSHRELLVKVRTMLTETALTDGWGRSIRPSSAEVEGGL